MITLGRRLEAFIDFCRDPKTNNIVIYLTYNDMFEWATSWGIQILTDSDKLISAYRSLYNYCKKNNIDFHDRFDKVEYPSTKTVEGIEKYFTENKLIYNDLIDALKDYNDFTRLTLEQEKFNSLGISI